jgi:hypothetical protein
MNGRERILAMLDGKPVDRLPFMPITMLFACDRIGAPYRDYATDCNVLAEGQTRTADDFDFVCVSTTSDSGGGAARHHLFCRLDVELLSRTPFEPEHIGHRILVAGELGWKLAGSPRVGFLPCLGGLVGSDILTRMLATNPCKGEDGSFARLREGTEHVPLHADPNFQETFVEEMAFPQGTSA